MGAAKIEGSIVKLTSHGLMAEVKEVPWRVGQILKATFTIEGYESVIVEDVRSIKTYDRYNKNARKDEPPNFSKLVEVHFLKLKPDTIRAIKKHAMKMAVEELRKVK